MPTPETRQWLLRVRPKKAANADPERIAAVRASVLNTIGNHLQENHGAILVDDPDADGGFSVRAPTRSLLDRLRFVLGFQQSKQTASVGKPFREAISPRPAENP